MQPDFAPYVSLYKYGLTTFLASASAGYETLRQLRALQLKTDKEMLSYVQGLSAEVDSATSIGALVAVQQKMLSDLMGREFAYLRDLEKIAREASSSVANSIRESQNPWQERMAQIAEGASRFLANGNAQGADRRVAEHA
ncbi:hypothetical protein DDE05_42580 [Streptomyces cavourensis]|jgi:hypothetical protein|nr:hypothetical protein DDE05_42580 [Streptomyces cavourensis]